MFLTWQGNYRADAIAQLSHLVFAVRLGQLRLDASFSFALKHVRLLLFRMALFVSVHRSPYQAPVRIKTKGNAFLLLALRSVGLLHVLGLLP